MLFMLMPVDVLERDEWIQQHNSLTTPSKYNGTYLRYGTLHAFIFEVWREATNKFASVVTAPLKKISKRLFYAKWCLCEI